MAPGSSAVNVTMTSLLTAPQVVNERFSIDSGQTYTYSVNESFELPIGSVVADFGLGISTSSPVVINVEDSSVSNTDSYALLPIPLLGTTYFAVGYNQTSTVAASFILVVAASRQTQVTISMSKLRNNETVTLNGVTYGQNDVIDVTLNALQVLQIQADSDLTGTKVVSSKPAAVFSGVNRTNIPAPVGTDKCFSHASDQLPPLPHWGRKFVLVSSPNQTAGDIYLFVSGWAGTVVTLKTDPQQTFYLAHPGDFFEYNLANETFVYAESTKPVMVAQITKSFVGSLPGGDPSLGIHAPLEQAESKYTLVSDANGLYTQYIAVIVNSTDKDGINLNGVSLSTYQTVWSPVPGTNFAVGIVELSNLPTQMMTLSHVSGRVFGAHSYTRTYCEARSMPLTYGSPLEMFNVLSRLAETQSGVRSDVFNIQYYHTRLTAEKVNVFTARGQLACAQDCMNDATCWGYNFNPSLTTGANCELLLGGDGSGVRINAGGWIHLGRNDK